VILRSSNFATTSLFSRARLMVVALAAMLVGIHGSASAATRSASSMRTMPTCSPPGPMRRTSGTRMRSLMRVSVLMGPPM